MSGQPSRLQRGDVLPFCSGMSSGNQYYSFEEQAGRPAALILAGRAPPAALKPLVDAFAARASDFDAAGADVRLLVELGAPSWLMAESPSLLRLVHCPTKALFEAAGRETAVLVCDRAMRLAARLSPDDPPGAAESALLAIGALPRETAARASCPAPVLVRPGLFDPDLCRRLVASFEAGDHVDGAIASLDADGGLYNRLDAAKKQRRDLVLDPAGALCGEVAEALSSRLTPEIAKAFQAEAAFIDRVVIARYDDTGGYFTRHRDNSSPHLAYRQFALSVNLNTGEYEGGALRFPEFNDVAYEPPAGAGIVFSASLLHEATPVTRGSRYVLLTFLHSAAAEAKRVAGLKAA